MSPDDPPNHEYSTNPDSPDPDRLADQLLDIAERQPGELTYDPDLEQLSVKGFQGAEGLTENDIASIDRAMRLLIQQRRKHLGHRIEGAEGELE